MKKSILLLCAVLLGSIHTYAQGINVGFKAGFNYSNFTINNVSSDGRAGLMAGAYLKINVSETFAIQPELLFMQRGGRLTYNDSTVQGTGDFSFNYIDIPVMLVFQPIPVLNFHFGPYASYLASVSARNRGVGSYDFGAVKRSQFNDWDFGLAAGAGFNVLFLTGGIRYNVGLTKVGTEDGGYILADGRNSTVTLYVGIQL